MRIVEVRKRTAARGERVGRGKMSWIVGIIVNKAGQRHSIRRL